MRDVKGELKGLVEEWRTLADGRLDENTLSEVTFTVGEKLKQINPVVSFYGAYNAGKSTLLNALVGEEIAKSGESPETFKLEEYKWGEWVVYDTPGIDAPIEHEELTEEHLRKSECVLFTFSTDGDLESAPVYEKIADLAIRNKPILLILNDKTRVLSNEDPSELVNIIERIDTNLDKTWRTQGLPADKKPEKVIINAASALKGKLQNKNLLLESSNIHQLESKLESFLRNRDDEDICNGLIDFLNPHVESLFTQIIKEKNTAKVREVKLSKKKLESKKRELKLGLDRIFRMELSALRTSLQSYGMELNEEQFKSQIEGTVSKVEKMVQGYLEPEFVKVAKEFDQEVTNIIKLDTTETDSTGGPSNTPETLVVEGSGMGQKVGELLKSEKGAGKAGEYTAKATEQILLKLRQWKFPGLKGRWGSTLAKWAGTTGKVVAKALPVIVAVYEIYQAHKQQKEYENRLKAQIESINLTITRVISDLDGGFSESCNAILDEFFEQFLDLLDELLKEGQGGEEKAFADEVELTRIQNSLNNLVLCL